jgi:hypothetical protein
MSLLHSDSISSTVFTFCWYVSHSELPVLLNSVSLDLMEILWKNESSELLTASIVDMLFLLETKIDDSFTDTQFQVNNCHFGRADRTAHGGGIAAYVRSDLQFHRLCLHFVGTFHIPNFRCC